MGMMLLPGPPDACPVCAVKHPPAMPHNRDSMHYQYRFFAIRSRWPTWADAAAHCAAEVQEFWRGEVEKEGIEWGNPEGGPIADPPAESINQVVEFENSEPQVIRMDGGEPQ
jgi:hypothetical protein